MADIEQQARELLPCPFCGSPGEVLGHGACFIVTCSADETECDPSPSTWGATTADEAAVAWNTRAEPKWRPIDAPEVLADSSTPDHFRDAAEMVGEGRGDGSS
jgi:hypothetical protein